MSNKIYLPSNRAPKPNEQRFNIAQPLATHYGWVSCKNYECEQFLNGWKLILPSGSEDAAYIRSIKDKVITVAIDGQGRELTHRYGFNEAPQPGGLVEFTFPAGQPCFRAAKHLWHVRPPLWMHDRGSDETRRMLSAIDFKDLMNEENGKLQRALERG